MLTPKQLKMRLSVKSRLDLCRPWREKTRKFDWILIFFGLTNPYIVTDLCESCTLQWAYGVPSILLCQIWLDRCTTFSNSTFWIAAISRRKQTLNAHVQPQTFRSPTPSELTLCPKNMSTFYFFLISLIKINRFQWFLVCEILRKFDIKSLYICPPHLSAVAMLPW